MLVDFQPVPTFTEGQPLSASDLNTFNLNNLVINRVLTAPQPLFMDSHIFAPKVLPMSWQDPYFIFWKGSFLYREGMKYAYIGFHTKLDADYTGMVDGEGGSISMVRFGANADSFRKGAATGAINVGIIVGNEDYSYANIAKANSAIYDKFFASAPLNTPATYSNVKGVYTFTIRDGQAMAVTEDGQLVANARVSQIRIDLDQLSNLQTVKLTDGDIVPIRLFFLVGDDPAKWDDLGDFASFYHYYKNCCSAEASYKNYYLTHIYYSTLYAYTDGDLSYTDNWPGDSSFTTTGSNVLSQSNINVLTKKQRYITDRLKNKPMPLTGSFFYLSSLGGSSSTKYPSFDWVLGETDQTRDDYAIPVSYDTEVWEPKNYFDTARLYNPQSTLATFAWNPYFDVYDTVLVDFQYFGNTGSRQVMIVDFPEAPVSLTSIRNNIVRFIDGKAAKSGHLDGYSLKPEGYYGSTIAGHTTLDYVNNSNSYKAYRNHMYQVRIPSTSIPVYSPEQGKFITNKFFFEKGFYEDQIQIVFTNRIDPLTELYTDKWGLYRNETTKETIQYGFVGNTNNSVLQTEFDKSKTIVTDEFNRFQYRKLTTYNNDNWFWNIPKNQTRGYSQIFVNLYDHSASKLELKANYISFCNLVGLSVFNPANTVKATPTRYTPEQELTYTQLCGILEGIDDDLTLYKDVLFTVNPHFKNYDMFWNAPLSPLITRNIHKDYADKFLSFTKQRTGNILIVRGKNVSLYYGEIKKLERKASPDKGSFTKLSDVNVELEKSVSLISGDTTETVVFHFSSISDLAYNQRYYVRGDELTYAAEFFEEPL